MLGYLLARAGVDVVILEKHADFFRDFRGDTIHPSTLEVMDELRLLDGLLKIPHSEIRTLSGNFGGTTVTIGDFSHVPGRCKFVAFMPQWDFLNYLAAEGKRFPGFTLRMETEAVDLLRENGAVRGVVARTHDGQETIRAKLVVAADGRHSTLREKAGLRVVEIGAPIDALWMRLSKKAGDPSQSFGTAVPGGIFVTIDRLTYYQCAFVIRKGGYAELQAGGLAAFRQKIAAMVPHLADRVDELRGWDDVRLLEVRVDRLERWSMPGLLCIGDAAHAMSPVGGVGINLAVQDAVAAANRLTASLASGTPKPSDLEAVQRRREFPTKVTQGIQVFIQDRFLNRVLQARGPISLPWPLRALALVPALRRIPARIIGVGVRPEHVAKQAVPPLQV